jgi:hypothetical protein
MESEFITYKRGTEGEFRAQGFQGVMHASFKENDIVVRFDPKATLQNKSAVTTWLQSKGFHKLSVQE